MLMTVARSLKFKFGLHSATGLKHEQCHSSRRLPDTQVHHCIHQTTPASSLIPRLFYLRRRIITRLPNWISRSQVLSCEKNASFPGSLLWEEDLIPRLSSLRSCLIPRLSPLRRRPHSQALSSEKKASFPGSLLWEEGLIPRLSSLRKRPHSQALFSEKKASFPGSLLWEEGLIPRLSALSRRLHCQALSSELESLIPRLSSLRRRRHSLSSQMREPGNETTPHYNCNQQTLKMKQNTMLRTYKLYLP